LEKLGIAEQSPEWSLEQRVPPAFQKERSFFQKARRFFQKARRFFQKARRFFLK